MSSSSRTKVVNSVRNESTLIAVGAILIGFYIIFRNLSWQGSTELHTIMETVATLLALIIGISALIRFYTNPNKILFLFIGAGFF